MILTILLILQTTVVIGQDGQDSAPQPCTNKNGTAVNSESCACGTSVCTSATGLFCLASLSTCNTKIMCSVSDGSSINSGNCACGTSDCDASTGLFCSALSNTCGEVATSNKFVVTAGTGCTTNGACFQSLNYPNNHGEDEQCSITVQSVSAGETLNSLAFNTESCCDKLIVKGTEYDGTTGPSGVAVAVNDVFTWSSDGSEQRSGFEVCLFGACLETGGSEANADTCGCGTAACSSSTGLFCTAATNTCSQCRSDQIVVDNVCTCPASMFNSCVDNVCTCTNPGVYKKLLLDHCTDGGDGWRTAVNEYECGDGFDRLNLTIDSDSARKATFQSQGHAFTETWTGGVTGCYIYTNDQSPWFNDANEGVKGSDQDSFGGHICVQDCRSDQIVVGNVCTDCRSDQIGVDNVCTCPASTFESPNGCTKSGVYKTQVTGSCYDDAGWRRAVNEYECGDGFDRLGEVVDDEYFRLVYQSQGHAFQEDSTNVVSGCYIWKDDNSPWFNIATTIMNTFDVDKEFIVGHICVQDCRSDQIVVDNVCNTTCSSTSHSCTFGSLKSSPDSITCSSSTCTDSECCNAATTCDGTGITENHALISGGSANGGTAGLPGATEAEGNTIEFTCDHLTVATDTTVATITYTCGSDGFVTFDADCPTSPPSYNGAPDNAAVPQAPSQTCSSTSHSCTFGSLKSSPDSITCSSSTCTDSECCNAPIINSETSVGDIRKNTALDKKQKMMQFKAVAIARKTKPSTITEIEDAYPDKLMRQKRERVKASKMELIKDDLPEVYATIKKRMKSKIEYVVAEYYPSETMDCDGLEDGIPNCCSYDFSQDMDTTVMVGLEETVGAWSVLCNGITIVSKQTRKSLTNETLGSANYDMQCWNGEQFGNNVAISTGGEHACGSYRVLVGSQFIDGITWTCIAEYQKMQTSEGHLRVDQLKTGDRIKMANGKYTTVQKIKKKAAPRHALHEVECNGATAHLTDNHVYRCNNRWHHPKNRGRRLSESDETIDVYSIQTENHCKDRLLTSSGLEIEPWDGREAGADRPYFYDETGYRRNCMTV